MMANKKKVRKWEGTKPEMVGEGGPEHEQQAQEVSLESGREITRMGEGGDEKSV